MTDCISSSRQIPDKKPIPVVSQDRLNVIFGVPVFIQILGQILEAGIIRALLASNLESAEIGANTEITTTESLYKPVNMVIDIRDLDLWLSKHLRIDCQTDQAIPGNYLG